MAEKCDLGFAGECPLQQRAEEIANDVKALDRKLDNFRNNVSETNGRFGGRIQKLEAREEVREEHYKHFKEELDCITEDMEDFPKENKNSIAELRKEHKESMEELRKGNKVILDAVTPLKHKVEILERLGEDVNKL